MINVGVFCQRRRLLRAASARRLNEVGREDVADAGRRRVREHDQVRHRRHQEHRRTLGRRGHGGDVPEGIRRETRRGSTSTSPAWPGWKTTSRGSPKGRRELRCARWWSSRSSSLRTGAPATVRALATSSKPRAPRTHRSGVTAAQDCSSKRLLLKFCGVILSESAPLLRGRVEGPLFWESSFDSSANFSCLFDIDPACDTTGLLAWLHSAGA